MTNLRILTDVEAFPLCRHDAFGISKTRAILSCHPGYPAYWSEHRYSHGGMIDLVDMANRYPMPGERYGLHAACSRLAASRPEQAAANIAFFLSRIHPANAAARAALIAAEAEWLATFSEVA